MGRIKGITVTLISKKEVGRDPFNKPIYEDVEIEVDNVLVSPTSTDDVVNTMNLTGRKAVYTLAIPKSDKNNWDNSEVRFFGERWQVLGIPLEGIEHLIPLDWNKKVTVARFE
jgi:hypothetical protein